MLHFSHYNLISLWCSQGENYLTDFLNPEGEMRVLPPEAPNAPVQMTVFVQWASFLFGTWIHHNSPKHISHWGCSCAALSGAAVHSLDITHLL